MTPLHYGFESKNKFVVEHLLQHCEANPDICDKVSLLRNFCPTEFITTCI